MSSFNSVRSLLAAMGANLKNIDGAFTQNDPGNRTYRSAANDIYEADYKIRTALNRNNQATSNYSTIPAANLINSNNTTFNPDTNMHPISIDKKATREERINKLLGKNPVVQSTINENSEYASMVNAFKKALEPMTEQLEDIAVLNGLLVQRIEQLINIVDSEPSENNIETIDTFPEEVSEPMEVYNPEVSMSLTDDEDEEQTSRNKKKKK